MKKKGGRPSRVAASIRREGQHDEDIQQENNSNPVAPRNPPPERSNESKSNKNGMRREQQRIGLQQEDNSHHSSQYSRRHSDPSMHKGENMRSSQSQPMANKKEPQSASCLTTTTTFIPDISSSHHEIDVPGRIWRAILQHLVVLTLDKVNAMRYTRFLQLFLPFLTGHESFVLAQVIEAMGLLNDSNDSNKRHTKETISLVLGQALLNRNVSRILVQSLGPRYDFLWHWGTMMTYNRLFDAWGQLPFVGITSFPPTENFPSTRNHALASMFRVLLGPGNWPTRVVTRGREGLLTDTPDQTAQNLAAESNGFEWANRNQFGNYFGRQKLNEFRFAHRLPTDESIVRTFVAQPMPTMINNGVVHVLRQLGKHWHNMLHQPSGNFSHQRMEQLGPFEALRFHIPEVLLVLASLRGRNRWDATTLGPMIQELQSLEVTATADQARKLARKLQVSIIPSVCAGVPSVLQPFLHWVKAIDKACDMIEKEAAQVLKIVKSVQKGILLGYQVYTQVSWKVPSDRHLEKLILDHIDGKFLPRRTDLRIRNALQLTTPRDKRTLIELVRLKLTETKPAKLLLGRVKTLLQREIRRELINQCIRKMSMGGNVTRAAHGEWYWLVDESKKDNRYNSNHHAELYAYDQKGSTGQMRRFVQVKSGKERFVSRLTKGVRVKSYMAVGEAISRAQKAFMTIELEYGKRFTYGAFMEFPFLRTLLRRLIVVSQLTCEELDNARLNILKETQVQSGKNQVRVGDLKPGNVYYFYDTEHKTYQRFVHDKYEEKRDLRSKLIFKVPPQNIIVIGGGPTGLMTTIHCAENVLISGGTVRLFEARDSLTKGGSSFERAQIVRLDARWISMLRYHLGALFEDVFIPASGETDSQLGNTLPTQGFVEITIKDLESVLHMEVSRLWSKGIISILSDSKAQFDHNSNRLTKFGRHLKVNDYILRQVDENGAPSPERYIWKIANLIYAQPLCLDDLRVENEYGVYLREHNAVLPFKLVNVCLRSRTYTFHSLTSGVGNLAANAQNLPSVYPKETDAHADVHAIILECTEVGCNGVKIRKEIFMADVKDDKFILDVGDCHVVEAIGKPHDSKVHFRVTTPEPYGVLCMQGLKVSLGMHTFGGKRWGSGLLDDIRSQNDQNTRIIGDFTKMVRVEKILSRMHEMVSAGGNWKIHFEKLLAGSPVMAPTDVSSALERLEKACDNFYLGMEFPREYEDWKTKLVDHIAILATNVQTDPIDAVKEQAKMKIILRHHLDRLWYEACLETIRTADVYNPGARHRVPHLYLIDSYIDEDLRSLPVCETFRLSNNPDDRYEILVKRASEVIVRNVEGLVSKFCPSTKVRRENNLTRTPDGNQESKVAIATFPVSHHVNYRTMVPNESHRGYMFTFIGDEQATPHFMRYSGLTGACINAMLLDNFIRQAIDGASFTKRFREYSMHTNWSSGEVVLRGTGGGYGEDGFLRPGFSYDDFIDYLYSRAVEHRESNQDLNMLLTHDWTVKVAASLIPRGMEINTEFTMALRLHLRYAIFNKVFGQANQAWKTGEKTLESALLHAHKHKEERENEQMDWDGVVDELNGSHELKQHLAECYTPLARSMERTCNNVIRHTAAAYLYNERVSSELFNQPKPVDSLVDDFTTEAQGFANSLVLGLALSSAALAFRLLGSSAFDALSTVVSILSVSISFETATNVGRYKIRQEEARIQFFDKKLVNVKKAIVGLLGSEMQGSFLESLNPFILELDKRVHRFQQSARYYDFEESNELKQAHKETQSNISDRRAIRSFQNLLASKLIVDTYQVNSYLQQDLVAIYKSLDDIIACLDANDNKEVDVHFEKDRIVKVFDQLNEFAVILEPSLQRGPIRWGFIKKRKLIHWDIVVVFRHLVNLLCRCLCIRALHFVPVEIATLHMLNQIKTLSSKCGSEKTAVLRREVRDLKELYWATHESNMASMIFVTAILVFASSMTSTIATIFSLESVQRVALWAGIPASFGALLAVNHFLRKIRILGNLWILLKRRARSTKNVQDHMRLQEICRVTSTQILLTMLRLGSAMAAAVALPFAISENGFGNQIATPMMLPFWIALAALGLAILATFFFFVVEYVIRYSLNARWPVSLVESFRDELDVLYWEFRKPWNDVETKQVQERETWEYVAREFLHRYRFDTVFAADRFGAILQYIQSGMDTGDQSNHHAFLFGGEEGEEKEEEQQEGQGMHHQEPETATPNN